MDKDLRARLSVRPVLELLEQLKVAQYIHRDVATRSEFEHYLDRWTSPDYDVFSVLWLTMQGSESKINLSGYGEASLELEVLGEILKGKCAGKVIYFASCSTLN